MKHSLAIVVKYHGATNYKGSRFSITSPRFKKRRMFDWNHALGSSDAQAEAVIPFALDAQLDMGDHFILTTDDWEAARKFFGVN